MKKGEAQQQRGLEESLPFHWRPAEIAVNAIIFKLVLAAKRRDPNAKAGGRGAGRGTVRRASMSRLCPDWARSRIHWNFLFSFNPTSSPGQLCPGGKERVFVTGRGKSLSQHQAASSCHGKGLRLAAVGGNKGTSVFFVPFQ